MSKRTAAAGTSHVGPWTVEREALRLQWRLRYLLHLPASSSIPSKFQVPRSQAGMRHLELNLHLTELHHHSAIPYSIQFGRLILHLDATIYAIELVAQIPLTPFTPRRHRPPRPSYESYCVADTTAVMAASLNALKAALDRIVVDPRYHHALALLKTARNGAVYGTKVRFPHALVMIFLFRSGTFRQKTTLVLRATKKHAFNLARFATIYKATMLALRYFGPNQGKEGPYDAFLGGLLGGYVVFGQRSPRSGKISSVSQQIVIYIFARVVLALARIAVTPGEGLRVVSREPLASQIRQYAWPAFASLSWGMVMQLFKTNPGDLQSSLRSSMTYIYQDCDEWDSLRTLLWHNK
ncbi:hypothetical protein E4U30_005864 [Claviceps sp. LM220 group G6]|nr:hypothetical protein E4U30_005864 [Claviceps sp. LM220 group G6]